MNKEIARSLVISAETVKWHIKNIYTELKANSRIQVVSRALEMELLDQRFEEEDSFDVSAQ